MKLLMITQKAVPDDPILGVFSEWIKALAAKVDQMTVIALEAREHEWPANVEIISLGKERGVNRLIRLKRLFLYANHQLAAENFDLVFCHMCPSYLLFLSPWAKALHIPLTLWYAHGQVSSSLKLALKLADEVYTSSKKSFRLSSAKVAITGQGIPTAWFECPQGTREKENDEEINIVTIGRISPSKDQLTFLKAAAEIVRERLISKPRFLVIGDALKAADKSYQVTLKEFCQNQGIMPYVEFVPACPPREIREWYKKGDVFVNTSKTGSLDKVILEAMAARKPIITSNDAGRALLKEVHPWLTFNCGDYRQLSKNLVSLLELDRQPYEHLTATLRSLVVDHHDVEQLAKKLVANFQRLVKHERPS